MKLKILSVKVRQNFAQIYKKSNVCDKRLGKTPIKAKVVLGFWHILCGTDRTGIVLKM